MGSEMCIRDRDGTYRFNPVRARPPRLLVTPAFHVLYSGAIAIPKEWKEDYERCLEKLRGLYPVFTADFMEGGHIIGGGFWIRTIWAHSPDVADIVIVTAPTDKGHLGLPMRYEQTGDETLLAHLIPIGISYLD